MSKSFQTRTVVTKTVTSDGKSTTVKKEVCADGKSVRTVTVTELAPQDSFNKNMGGLCTKHTSDSDVKSSGNFEKDALKKHNEYRKKHGVQALKLNKEMCRYAKAWAEEMAKSGDFKHRTERKYGENIYYGMNSRGVNPLDAIDSWYNEISKMNFSNPEGSSGTGHFTQLVWKESTELGIGMAEPKPGEVYVVANYNPPGNFIGRYKDNVFPPK